ncbi:MAG: spondin domain-containing protein [Xanthomonadales bacterium]|nr:spondin domain-containing protein [Xanthomonadales bacterium]
MKFSKHLRTVLFPAALFLTAQTQAVEVTVKVENLSPEGGLYFTPLWVGFHDGSFDIYDLGAAASSGVERFAEDGDFSTLRADFATSGGLDEVILNPEGFSGAPVFDPGMVSNEIFDLDPNEHQYFSYGAMILPSNDAFIANGDPTAHQLFDDQGEFTGPISFVVYGSEVLDAGTEANTETDAAFLNQSTPDTGQSTNDPVALHPGFNGSIGNPEATPMNILGAMVPPGTTIDVIKGDFTQGIFPVMRVTIQKTTTPVRVSVKNTASDGGTFFTPLWVGFHDGLFDIYDRGVAASEGLERFAEDGDFSVLRSDFAQFNGQDAMILNPAGFAGAPVFDPSLVSSEIFELNPATDQYFSYASMLLPSNDAFFANGNPMAHHLFDNEGNFTGPIRVKIYGKDILDAGTEANTESDAAFFNQMAPNTGETTTDTVMTHPGFNGSQGNPDATPQVFLGGTGGPGIHFDETAADFTTEGYQVAEIRLTSLVDGSFSGSWYNPAKDGHGLVIEITQNANGKGTQAVVSWYHYAADGSGEQVWLIGNGPVIADTAIVELVQTNGAIFGEAFNADDVNKINWGQLRIKFNSCSEAILSYDSLLEEYGSGQEPLTRITSGPVGFNGACQL